MKTSAAAILFAILFLFVGCSSGDKDQGSTSGSAVAWPDDFPKPQTETGGGSSGSGSSSTGSETGTYVASDNGRGVWTFSKVMSAYPSTFTLSACGTTQSVTNKGGRWQNGDYVIKQSPGYGVMIFVSPAGCSGSVFIKY